MGITPAGMETRWAHDVFGNSVCYVDPGETTTDHLQFVSTLDIEHFPAARDLSIDKLAETYPFSYPAEEFPDLARLIERHYLDPEGVLDVWARKFINRNGPTGTMELLTGITEAIKADFTYQARDAEGTNGPLETLGSGAGACRDFALLMMEAARTLGFAARFVSGYLYDEDLVDSPDPVKGGGATPCLVQHLSARRRLGRVRSDQRPRRRAQSHPRVRRTDAGPGRADRWRLYRDLGGFRGDGGECRGDGWRGCCRRISRRRDGYGGRAGGSGLERDEI